ncbi:MAG: protein TolR [Oleiphilaceae bacterium]|nr:protein TolR [Oleiphilaceae bacterium]
MSRPKRKPMSDINVVPYIDVMLVLLIIFMVTAPMLTQGIKIDLPKVEAAPVKLEKNQEPLIISVDANGAYYLDLSSSSTKPLGLKEMLQKASAVFAERPGVTTLIRGDRNVEYGVVVDLMAALQEAGASSVGLITEEP